MVPQRASAVDITLPKVREVRTSAQELGVGEQYFYQVSLGGVAALDLSNGERRESGFGRVMSYFPPSGARILAGVATSEDGEPVEQLYRFDARSGEAELLGRRFSAPTSILLDFQADTLYGSGGVEEGGIGPIVEIDARSGRIVRQVQIPGVGQWVRLAAVSPDRRLLLVDSVLAEQTQWFLTYDLETGGVVGRAKAWGFMSGFLTTGTVYQWLQPELAMSVYSIAGQRLDTIKLIVAEDVDSTYRSLGSGMHYLALGKRYGREVVYYFYDLKPLRDYLESRNWAFRPVAGVAKASGVRVREYANLGAETMGLLSTGDRLEALDRSGAKAQVGDQEAWWYKVRRASDGLEGWSYGAYIEVESEQSGL
jgi:hypothetical protein